MADVSFNEEPTYARPASTTPRRASLTDLVQKWGFAKDQKSAEIVLISVFVVAVVATGFLLFSSSGSHAPIYAPHIPPPTTIPSQ